MTVTTIRRKTKKKTSSTPTSFSEVPVTLTPKNQEEVIKLLVTLGYLIPIITAVALDLGFQVRPTYLQFIRKPWFLAFFVASTVYIEIETVWISIVSALFIVLMLRV